MLSFKSATVLLLFALLFCGEIAAQTGPTGGLSGVVTDPSGAAIPGARIHVKGEGTGLTRDGETNASGYWEVRFLPLGTYRVEVRASGFQTLVQTGVKVEAAVPWVLPSATESS